MAYLSQGVAGAFRHQVEVAYQSLVEVAYRNLGVVEGVHLDHQKLTLASFRVVVEFLPFQVGEGEP